MKVWLTIAFALGLFSTSLMDNTILDGFIIIILYVFTLSSFCNLEWKTMKDSWYKGYDAGYKDINNSIKSTSYADGFNKGNILGKESGLKDFQEFLIEEGYAHLDKNKNFVMRSRRKHTTESKR